MTAHLKKMAALTLLAVALLVTGCASTETRNGVTIERRGGLNVPFL